MTTTTQQHLSTRSLYRYEDVIGLLSAGGVGFSGPVAIDFGPDGLMYVASRGNRNQPEAIRVTKATRDGDYTGEFGGWGDAPGKFMWVTDIAFSHEGNLYLSDEHLQRISAFNTDGEYLHSFGEQGSGEGQLDRPSGIAFDSQDNLYVVDSLNNRVQVFDKQGKFLDTWGEQGEGEGQFRMPWGICIDQADNIYITDWRNDRVQKFASGGQFLMTFGRAGSGEYEFNRPNGITVDADGDIYVCDWMNDRVQIFDANASYKDTLIGHSGMSKWGKRFLDANPEVEEKLNRATQNIEIKMRFYRPRDVKVDSDGKVYVVDCYRHRVQIYQKLSVLQS
jgi:DNA-binding beta-propeller fold protein YncE